MKQYTEQEIKSMVTPEIIKKMVELAEGFVITEPTLKNPAQEFGIIYFNNCVWDFVDINDFDLFPLLIHRAVEGWDRTNKPCHIEVNYYNRIIYYYIPSSPSRPFQFKNYQPRSLTQLELALLHCLIEVLKEEMK